MTNGSASSAPELVEQAKWAYEGGRVEECRRLLSDALSVDPTCIEALELAGSLFPELSCEETDRGIAVGGWSEQSMLESDWGAALGGEDVTEQAPSETGAHPEAFEMSPPDEEQANPADAFASEQDHQVIETTSVDSSGPGRSAAAESAPVFEPDPNTEDGSDDSQGCPAAFEMAPPCSDWAPGFEPEAKTDSRQVVEPAAGAPPFDGVDAEVVPPPAPGLELLSKHDEEEEPSLQDAENEQAAAGIDTDDDAPADSGAGGEPEDDPEAVDPLDEEVASLLEGAAELFELADFSGSLELVEKALEIRPDDRQALDYLARNQETLVQMYESKLGSPDRRPRLAIAPDEVIWLNLDHRAGYVLSQIDGEVTLDDLYILSGMSRLDTSRILAQLMEEGVLSFE